MRARSTKGGLCDEDCSLCKDIGCELNENYEAQESLNEAYFQEDDE